MDVSLLDLAIKQSLNHLLPWMLWAKREPVNLQERIEFLRNVRGNFDLGVDFGYLIFNPSETILLGGIGLHTRLGQGAREIGYWIHKDYINQGYATETSASVPRKLGFIHEATLHNRLENSAGNLRDSMIWTLFEENYPTSLAAQADIQAFDVIGRRII
jgi:RimJ/RimL family protein N-acetyltransferase